MKLLRNAPAPLMLDFTPQPRRRPGAFGWLALAVGAVLLLIAALDFVVTRIDLAERAAIVEALRAEQRTTSRADAAEAPPRAEELMPAQAAAAQLGIDWGGMLAALASARGEDIALLEISADGTRGSVRLGGEAEAPDAAFAFVQRVQASGALQDVRLDNHEWVAGPAGSVLRFTVSARWGGGR